MSPRVGNISFPVMKPTEPSKKFYSDKLARLMDEVRSYVMLFYVSSRQHLTVVSLQLSKRRVQRSAGKH